MVHVVRVQGAGEGEEILLVECIIVEMDHWVWDNDVPLLRTSVHGGTGAENINYRILIVSKGFKLSDTRYVAICSDHI